MAVRFSPPLHLPIENAMRTYRAYHRHIDSTESSHCHARATVSVDLDSAPVGTAWTCPMHPQIVRDGPGSCPLCGMALEPILLSIDDDQVRAEIAAVRRRLFVSAAFTVPVAVIAMLPHLSGHHMPAWSPWLQFTLTSLVVLWGGAPFFARFVRSIANRSPNMYTLIGLGVGVAYGYSVVATLMPAVFPPTFRDAHGEVGLYFEAAAVIVALVLLGEWLELRARHRSGDAIRCLLRLAPKTARKRFADGREEDVPLASVQVGDMLRVRPGERVPVDGSVSDGTSHIDESMLSGEAMPVAKFAGDRLTSGTLNMDGTLLLHADKVGADTLLAQIVRLVAEAQRSRAPLQRLADRVAAWFVPAVIIAAVLAFAVWAFVGPEPRFTHALLAAVAVLIVACPCALGLATPISVLVATGRGAQLGVLFRDAAAIETLQSIDTLVIDKTGTLTLGKPTLTDVVTLGVFDEAQLVAFAAALEMGSEHPMAAAILAGAKARGLVVAPAAEFKALTGRGVTGRVDRYAIALGNTVLMNELGVAVDTACADALRADGRSVMFLAVDSVLVGLVGVADPIRSTTPEALAQLRVDGVEIHMLTGDNAITAKAVALKLGIQHVAADLQPSDKARIVRELQAQGRRVAMAGDGINDAPALAAAELGIAMGQGSDIALESARAALVHGDLRGIARARTLSRATVANIRQNLFFAFIYNALGIPLAAGALYPLTGWLLNPAFAALAMSLSSVSVIANALRLRRAAA